MVILGIVMVFLGLILILKGLSPHGLFLLYFRENCNLSYE